MIIRQLVELEKDTVVYKGFVNLDTFAWIGEGASFPYFLNVHDQCIFNSLKYFQIFIFIFQNWT